MIGKNNLKFLLIIIGGIFLIISGLIYYYLTVYNNSLKSVSIADESKVLKDITPFNNTILATKSEDLPPKDELNGYGIRVFNESGQMVKNGSVEIDDDETTVKLYISLANANQYSDTIGFYIFIDEILQKFTIDENKELVQFYSHRMEEFSLINIPITLEPKVNLQRENHTIWVVLVTSMNEFPNDLHHIPYFVSTAYFNFYIPEVNKSAYKYNKDIDIELGKISERYKKLEKQDSFRAAISISGNEFLYQEPTLNLIESGTNLRFQAVNEIGEYATYFFIDHKPVTVNNSDAILWSIKSNEDMLNTQIKLETPVLNESIFYSLTIPLDRNSNHFDINESEKILLKRN